MVPAADSQPRIVSLIASATEIVCALGARDRLVGRSHECDFPEDVKALPVLTSPKFLVNGSSYEIDQRVKAILQEGLSVYRVDVEKLKGASPPRHRHSGSLRGLSAALTLPHAHRPRCVTLGQLTYDLPTANCSPVFKVHSNVNLVRGAN